MTTLPHEKGEKQSDADDGGGALRSLQQRSRQIARELQRRIEGRREQRYAGVDLRDEPDPEQREAEIADPAFEKHTISPLRNALAQPRCAIECQRRDRTAGRRLPMSASSSPNGAYAITLIATSKRTTRGHGANAKNGVPGSGGIQPENASR